jgi:pimeloyl-ACP methyl ester carboxylesterase
LTLPVELVHGDADTIVPLTIHSVPLSKILPNVHLTVLPGTGHMPHHAQAQAVVAAIARAAAHARLR